MMTELIEKEGKEIGQITKENWKNFSNFILTSNGVRRLVGHWTQFLIISMKDMSNQSKSSFFGLEMDENGLDWVKWINTDKKSLPTFL